MGPIINRSGAAGYSKGISAGAGGSTGTSGGTNGKPSGIGFPSGSMPENQDKYITQMYDI